MDSPAYLAPKSDNVAYDLPAVTFRQVRVDLDTGIGRVNAVQADHIQGQLVRAPVPVMVEEVDRRGQAVAVRLQATDGVEAGVSCVTLAAGGEVFSHGEHVHLQVTAPTLQVERHVEGERVVQRSRELGPRPLEHALHLLHAAREEGLTELLSPAQVDMLDLGLDF